MRASYVNLPSSWACILLATSLNGTWRSSNSVIDIYLILVILTTFINKLQLKSQLAAENTNRGWKLKSQLNVESWNRISALKNRIAIESWNRDWALKCRIVVEGWNRGWALERRSFHNHIHDNLWLIINCMKPILNMWGISSTINRRVWLTLVGRYRPRNETSI